MWHGPDLLTKRHRCCNLCLINHVAAWLTSPVTAFASWNLQMSERASHFSVLGTRWSGEVPSVLNYAGSSHLPCPLLLAPIIPPWTKVPKESGEVQRWSSSPLAVLCASFPKPCLRNQSWGYPQNSSRAPFFNHLRFINCLLYPQHLQEAEINNSPQVVQSLIEERDIKKPQYWQPC